MCKIVFFDLDGTVLCHDKTLAPDTVDAIAALKALGIEPVIATGRAPYFTGAIERALGIDSVINFNGSLVRYRGRVIHRNQIDPSDLERVVRLARELGHPMSFLAEHAIGTTDGAHPHVVESFDFNGHEIPAADPDFWRRHPVFQAYVHCRPGEERRYREAIPELNFLRWNPERICTMDVLPKTSNKAVGMQKILAHTGVAPAEVIALGDGQNDIEMLAYAGIGVAMGNAHEDLLPHADMVTRHVDEGGFRHALKMLEVL